MPIDIYSDAVFSYYSSATLTHNVCAMRPYDPTGNRRVAASSQMSAYERARSAVLQSTDRLRSFIAGTRAAPFSTVPRAYTLGRVVAQYDEVIATLDLESVRGCFRLPLFEIEAVAARLVDARAAFDQRRDEGVLATMASEAIPAM